MNTENVISLEAVSASLLSFRRVKMTAAGVDYAAAGDLCIGTVLPGDLNRDYHEVGPSWISRANVLGAVRRKRSECWMRLVRALTTESLSSANPAAAPRATISEMCSGPLADLSRL